MTNWWRWGKSSVTWPEYGDTARTTPLCWIFKAVPWFHPSCPTMAGRLLQWWLAGTNAGILTALETGVCFIVHSMIVLPQWLEFYNPSSHQIAALCFLLVAAAATTAVISTTSMASDVEFSSSCFASERTTLLSFRSGITDELANRLGSWRGRDYYWGRSQKVKFLNVRGGQQC